MFQSLVRLDPRAFRWTRDEYYRVAELGVFDGHRVELIDGEVLEMSPPGSPHSVMVELVRRAVQSAFGSEYWVRTEQPLNLFLDAAPQPDISVVRGEPRDFLDEHPQTALLVVEVAESSLDFDSSRKAALYAQAGIDEYWIVNLVDERLDVFRNPVVDANVQFGASFSSTRSFRRGESVSPLAAPQSIVRVAELLP